MSKKEKWEPCPRCGSNRVKSMGMLFFVLLGIGLAGIGILLLLFIPIIGIPMIIAGLALLLVSPFTKGILQCEDCKKSWKYPTTKNAKA